MTPATKALIRHYGFRQLAGSLVAGLILGFILWPLETKNPLDFNWFIAPIPCRLFILIPIFYSQILLFNPWFSPLVLPRHFLRLPLPTWNLAGVVLGSSMVSSSLMMAELMGVFRLLTGKAVPIVAFAVFAGTAAVWFLALMWSSNSFKRWSMLLRFLPSVAILFALPAYLLLRNPWPMWLGSVRAALGLPLLSFVMAMPLLLAGMWVGCLALARQRCGEQLMGDVELGLGSDDSLNAAPRPVRSHAPEPFRPATLPARASAPGSAPAPARSYAQHHARHKLALSGFTSPARALLWLEWTQANQILLFGPAAFILLFEFVQAISVSGYHLLSQSLVFTLVGSAMAGLASGNFLIGRSALVPHHYHRLSIYTATLPVSDRTFAWIRLGFAAATVGLVSGLLVGFFILLCLFVDPSGPQFSRHEWANMVLIGLSAPLLGWAVMSIIALLGTLAPFRAVAVALKGVMLLGGILIYLAAKSGVLPVQALQAGRGAMPWLSGAALIGAVWLAYGAAWRRRILGGLAAWALPLAALGVGLLAVAVLHHVFPAPSPWLILLGAALPSLAVAPLAVMPLVTAQIRHQ